MGQDLKSFRYVATFYFWTEGIMFYFLWLMPWQGFCFNFILFLLNIFWTVTNESCYVILNLVIIIHQWLWLHNFDEKHNLSAPMMWFQ